MDTGKTSKTCFALAMQAEAYAACHWYGETFVRFGAIQISLEFIVPDRLIRMLSWGNSAPATLFLQLGISVLVQLQNQIPRAKRLYQ